MDSISPYLPALLRGLGVTVEITVLGTLVMLASGFALGVVNMSRFRLSRGAARAVIEFFRGTSALVQLFWAFYVLPFFGINLSPITTAVVVLGLNQGAYVAEVVRSGLQSVPVNQREAALALSLPRMRRFTSVILPQSLPFMIPPIGNLTINLLKLTSLASLVTVTDLTFEIQTVRTNIGQTTALFVVLLASYFVLSSLIAALVKRLERVATRRWQPDARLSANLAA